MAKNRTIEELHDPKIGHRKFAMVVDSLIASGHSVSEIKESYEKFSFRVDGTFFEFQKAWRASALNFSTYVEDMLAMKDEIEELAEAKANGD